jgi:hypothetical protein
LGDHVVFALVVVDGGSHPSITIILQSPICGSPLPFWLMEVCRSSKGKTREILCLYAHEKHTAAPGNVRLVGEISITITFWRAIADTLS